MKTKIKYFFIYIKLYIRIKIYYFNKRKIKNNGIFKICLKVQKNLFFKNMFLLINKLM